MKRVVLFTKDKCPHCQTAKRYLDENNIAYRSCNVKTAAGQKEFALTKMRGVPVLKIGDQLLSGFSIKNFTHLYRS